ncbi:MAG: hypothetical protein EXR77_08505 [Myxococcales bacterium]|nr:hypothetical protein [Myxococcales bacterium]
MIQDFVRFSSFAFVRCAALASAWTVAAIAVAGCAESTLVARSTGNASADAAVTEATTTTDSGAADALAVEAVAADGLAIDALADGAVGDDAVAAETVIDAAVAEVAPTVCTADELKKCNDGLACTQDDCTVVAGSGAICGWTLKKDTCLIGGGCQLKGGAKPGDACVQCVPESATATWSAAPDGSACDDGDLCTWQGKCAQKQCKSLTVPCDDGKSCTADLCDPSKGCTYPVEVGKACDDGSACTSGDFCIPDGSCGGNPLGCDDKNPCTTDSCLPAKGCTQTDNADGCSDGDACTDSDKCKQGGCAAGSVSNCDDGNTCTLDFCEKASGCYHLPLQSPCCTGQTSICDDNNPCTNDDCDPKTSGCAHTNNTAACNDNNACTATDLCTGGQCAGAKKTCDDKSVCTSDACDPAKGCLFTPAGSAPCDDGNACTKADVCAAGVCKGAGQCACTPTFASQAIKFNSILIGLGGNPGEGIDLDDNPKTCAPKTNCSAGINNALGALAGLANGPLDKSVKDGAVSFVLEFKDFKQGPVNLALYPAKLDATNVTCDSTKATCNFVVDAKTIDPQLCKPTIALPGTLAGNLVNAGGKGSNFPIAIPLQPGVNLLVTIYGARLIGNATLIGSTVTGFEGILSGSVPKATLLAAIEALPEEGLPLPKDALKSILDTAVENDIDSDGNGSLDAASLALKVKGGPGKIVGTY